MNNEINKLIEFEKMEKKHKEDFFDIKKEFASKKIELLKKHHSENRDLCIKNLQNAQKSGYTLELLKNKLKDKITLHEKHLQEWQKLCDEKRDKMNEWKEKNKQERENFKKTL